MMQLKIVKFIQIPIFGVVIFFVISAFGLNLMKNEVIETIDLHQAKRQLPKSSFEFKENEYAKLGNPSLHLSYSPPRLHLPDMRNSLIYYGQNGRPDGSLESPKLYFGLQSGKNIASIAPGEKIYLLYDKTLSTPNKYIFSPHNEPTMVWFTADCCGTEAKITLAMSDVDGLLVASDDHNRTLSLPEKEFTRQASHGVWEMGKWRVDGSLLVRQKARWIGVDRFLENHGGDEYLGFAEKQRIDFGEGDEAYSIYVKKGDCLLWDQDRWSSYDSSLYSKDKPLLVVKKVDERVMTMDLWDTEGKGKVSLSLIRVPESFRHEQITRDFRFAGARTKTQVVFQVDDERLIVKPNDWLLQTKDGWRKLNTSSEIDDYVNRKLVGPLFIFQEIAKKDDKSILIGSLYNPNRTEQHQIEVAMIPASNLRPSQLPSGLQPQDRINQENNIQAATPLATH